MSTIFEESIPDLSQVNLGKLPKELQEDQQAEQI
jgi:hypothetical protein